MQAMHLDCALSAKFPRTTDLSFQPPSAKALTTRGMSMCSGTGVTMQDESKFCESTKTKCMPTLSKELRRLFTCLVYWDLLQSVCAEQTSIAFGLKKGWGYAGIEQARKSPRYCVSQPPFALPF